MSWHVDELVDTEEERPAKEPAKETAQAAAPVEQPATTAEQPAIQTKLLQNISQDKIQFRWKICVVGPGGVGKSTMLHRYFYKQFLPDMIMTIGVSHMSHVIERHGKVINLIIWDLSGQKRFEVLHPAYVGDATGAFVVFDISQPDTLDDVNKWVELIRRYNVNNKSLPIVLVGTKVDLLTDQAQLDCIYKTIEEKMAELELQYVCVTSSKTNYNVTETIDFLVDYILWSRGIQ
ncbi:MAG: GTP-binding protein [Candidatus Lokiarchaeota archaeon]|nr:GTP-binding protein [Candidatus Lokiarchaeota archaeon]